MGTNTRAGLRRIRINRYRVSGSIRVFVGGDHLREIEMPGQIWRHGRADQTGRVAYHECHFFGGHVRGGDDEVAFIFAGEVVEHDYEFAIFCTPAVSRDVCRRTGKWWCLRLSVMGS